MVLTALAVSLPPEAIRKKAAEVLARPDFAIDGAVNPAAVKNFEELYGFVRRLFIAFLEMLDQLPLPIKWLVLAFLVISLIGIIAHLIYTLWIVLFQPGDRLKFADAEEAKVQPENLEAAAMKAQAKGDWIGAIRILFQASLLRLEQNDRRSFRRGVTNREILRKYSSTGAYEPLAWFVQTIDQKWYGLESSDETDWKLGVRHHQTICDLVSRRQHVVSA